MLKSTIAFLYYMKINDNIVLYIIKGVDEIMYNICISLLIFNIFSNIEDDDV